MRNAKLDYTVVGAFVLAMFAGTLGAMVMLGGNSGPTERYETVYDNVGGLKYGTQVLYEGYPIGQVEAIEPIQAEGRMRFRVELGVASDWPIPDDSVAQVTASGLLAAMTINIRGGSSATRLPPGGRLAGIEAADLFAAMSSVAGEITALSDQEIKPFLRQLGGTVGQLGELIGEDGRALAGTLQKMADDLHAQSGPIVAQLGEFVARLDRSGQQLEQLLGARNLDRVEATLGNLEQTSAGFTRLLATLDLTRASLDALLSDLHGVVLSNGPALEQSSRDLAHVIASLASHVDGVNANLAATSRNLSEFSREIRQNPGLLLGSKPLPDEATR